MEIVKNTKNNGVLTIKEIDYETTKKMMLENHYSHKWNTAFGKINIGVFKEGRLLGACSFGNLMNPNSHSKITDLGKDAVIELNRMWLDDELGKNAETVLISSSIKIIKQLYPEIKFIQSFADGRLGCGTVYKASNFKYFGYEKSLFFEDSETNEVFHKVPLENTKRPYGFLIKNRRYLDGKLVAFEVKTYRYIYQIYKNHKCKLEELQYPSYDIGQNNIEYTHSIGLLTRLSIMYEAIGDKEYLKKAKCELYQRYTKEEIRNEIISQSKSASIKWFLLEYIQNEDNVKKLLPTQKE